MNRLILLALVGSALAFTPSTAKAQFPAYGQTGITVPGWIPTEAVGDIGFRAWYSTRFFSAAPLRGHYFPVAYPAHGYGWYPYGRYAYGWHPYYNALAPFCGPRTTVNVNVTRRWETPPRRPLVPMPTVAAPNDPNRAVLVLRVPANAEVWLGGTKMEGETGSERTVTTPELEPGKTYAYDVKVRWDDREWENEVVLQPGHRASLSVLDGGKSEIRSTKSEGNQKAQIVMTETARR